MSKRRPEPIRPNRLRPHLLHAYRWAVFVLIIGLIHRQHQWYLAQQQGRQQATVAVEQLQRFYPAAVSLAEFRPEQGGQTVADADGKPLGYVVRTSPVSDSIVGYSGPTNMLIAFDGENRILGIDVISTRDTPEHLEAVRTDELFMTAWNGLTWDQAARRQDLQGVSGATLTSQAIARGIVKRLGGTPHSSRFPEPLTVEQVRPFFPAAVDLAARPDKPGMLNVTAADGQTLGAVFRTTPDADDLIGFQGPTDTRVALDRDDRVLGFAVHRSYDNDEYVDYIRDDRYFLELFNGQTLDELAAMNASRVEGVSGATMTSRVMAQGIAAAAQRLVTYEPPPPRPWIVVKPRDVGTALVVAFATLLAFTSLRSKRTVRVGFQLVLIVYLGLINGDLISQVLIVGWAQSGVPWRAAPGLALLVAAAFLLPFATRRQLYCHHVCPHGAAQQLLKNVVPYQWKPPVWLTRGLSALPWFLLLVVLVVAMRHLPLNLAAIEPFDAYVFRVAGWASIAVALIGLAVSLVVPMAYCRFGCPTGAVLNFLRLQGQGDRFRLRDALALVLLVAAGCLYLIR